ncbi:hypothetical protein [Stenotrophomonas sp. Iso1]|uniref:hypothetical protein n=1 Tax=Stenotrophomonas sp. Iso1 TaxID=2977283 RepID=UPI0022B7BB13|nr:hypothetical protein [Stenotrophomonas sp. Iso1]
MNVLRWSVRVLAAVGLVVVGVWLVSRLMPMPKAQRDALALLRPVPAGLPSGGNAFDGIWLLGFDGVPDAEREGIVAEDGTRMQRLAERPDDAPMTPVDIASVAQGRYPQVAEVTLPCRWREAGCLAQVRVDPDAVEAALVAQRGLLKRIDALSGDSHYRNRFSADARLPIPSFNLLQRSLSAHALAHVQGRSDEALAGICSDVRTAKVLMSHSDGLVPANIGAAMIGGNVRLLASVLAELPVEHPLPATCDGVFVAPVPQALSLCPAMQGEFAMVSGSIETTPSGFAWLALDKQKTEGLLALSMAGACSQRTMEALAADIPAQWPVASSSPRRLECAANALGCIVARISGPAFDKHGLSLQDAGARLRLAEALLWLRANPQADAKAGLAQMPARLREGARPLLLSSDGTSLEVTSYYGKDNGVAFAVPLPGTATMH